MKREIETYSLQLNDHAVIVEHGTRAEAHWLDLGYSAVVEHLPVEPPAVDGGEKPKRRGRKVAVGADGVVVDE